MMATESSIQLVYQIALMLHVHISNDVHSLEIKTTSRIEKSSLWVSITALRMVSILTSGFSAFSATAKSANYISMQRDKKPLGAFKTAIKGNSDLMFLSTTLIFVYSEF